ncbi:uncharacterized protein LOC120328231 [Styela clava]
MKIREDSPPGAYVVTSNVMARKYTKPSEVIDACMDVLREEGGDNCILQTESPRATTQRGESVDLPLSPTMGEFDPDLLHPFYPDCEKIADRTMGQGISSVNLSGDPFSPEMLSPSSNPSFSGRNDSSMSMRYPRQCEERVAENIGLNCDIVTGSNEQSGFTVRRHSQHAHVGRTGRRFLSSETIGSSSSCSHNYIANVHKQGAVLVDHNLDDARRENSAVFSASAKTGEEDRRTLRDNSSSTFESVLKSVVSSGVSCELDTAISATRSRRGSANIQSSDIFTNKISPKSRISNYSSCRLNVPHDEFLSCDISVDEKVSNQRVDASLPMTKNYASHKSSACLLEEEWKRKSEYGSADPAMHEASFGQASDVQSSIYSANIGKTYSASGSISDRIVGTTEKVRFDSASNRASRLPVGTKINLSHDDRSTAASYDVGTSYLPVQTLTRKANCAQGAGRERQGLDRPSEKIAVSSSYSNAHDSSGEDNNKPVNLCLLQEKREYQLGQKQFPSKDTRNREFRKYTKSFSIRPRPYQHSKRLNESQCTVGAVSPDKNQIFDLGCIDDKSDWNRKAGICDMGVENRTNLGTYNKEPFLAGFGQRSTADSNLSSLFSTSGSSHMMVQDEAKTYAVLSGRHNEDLMNPHSLPTKGSSQQQQSLYQQSRISHSIINYAGPQGHSPDLRATAMSPSPPVRDHRATPSSSLPGILPSSTVFSNILVGRQQHISVSPSRREEYHAHDSFQRHYEHLSNPFEPGISESRHSFQPRHPLSLDHHAGTSTFSPVQISPQDHQQVFSSHSASIMPYGGSLQIAQHQGYLKPPPVHLDDMSDEERERMRVKRERNRVAAAKCRNRRRELLERLEKEAEQLEREQELLRENVRRLRVQKLQLGNMLEEHEPSCQKTISEEEIKTLEEKERNSNDDQLKSASSGGMDTNESSASKISSSPPQVTTQA